MNLLTRKHVLIGLLVLGVSLTLGLLQRQQEVRSRAGASTTLSLTPASSTNNAGDIISFDIMVTPGTNLVTFVKFQLAYDPTKLEPISPEPFTLNAAAFATKDGPVVTSGSLLGSASIGADPTKTIQTPTKVGTVKFKALASTAGAPTTITFGSATQALSSGPNDQSKENVLSTTTPASIIIGGTTDNAAGACTSFPATFTAELKGSEEVPANTSGATGKFTLTVTSATNATATVQTTNLQENQVMSMHIHSPAARGVSANTRVTLFDSPGTFKTPFSPGNVTVPADVLTDIRTGQAYVNIHTNQNPSGEIRGQLTCATADAAAPSPAPSGTPLSFELLLHGVGAAGDNPNPGGSDLSNKNPIHPQRNLQVEVYDTDNKLVTSISGPLSLNYEDGTGTFVGKLYMPADIKEGSYNLKVKTDRYLKRRVPGILNIKPKQENAVPKVDLVAGDVNSDNILNIVDYNAFLDCGYGHLEPLSIEDPNSLFNRPECQAHKPAVLVDIDDNNVINSFDYNLFLRELSVQTGD